MDPRRRLLLPPRAPAKSASRAMSVLCPNDLSRRHRNLVLRVRLKSVRRSIVPRISARRRSSRDTRISARKQDLAPKVTSSLARSTSIPTRAAGISRVSTRRGTTARGG